jgi:uncharacterized protein (DUF1684 family)
VAAVYRRRNEALGSGGDPETVWCEFRAARDELFRTHSQSALAPAERGRFQGLAYFPYNSDAAVEGVLQTAAEPRTLAVHTSGEESMPMTLAAVVRFPYGGEERSLSIFWIDVYGGGLFLPFHDLTAPTETYGGGRYLIDTIKGSDFPRLWREGGTRRVILDFNYAYNPSCAYDHRWVCPLAPPENRLPVGIRAGERVYRPRETGE